ncbi:MAG TPA: hypothetical protein PLU55_03960 [Candidatus Pacearchaeota archaeon]|nr:hypothetical protein [Candidatus Pacearchaeota archaeon]
MTNDEKIKNMSIDERAVFFAKYMSCELCENNYTPENKCINDDMCVLKMKKYLESEAE